jgi:CheY-like chemotaxis protein
LNTSRSENTISVTINQDGANVSIEIKDNGRGIAPADLAEIFKPFFSRSASSGGTGLGLPIVRRIVEEAGGRLEIDSEVGVGTSVRVYLPARPHVAKAVKIAPNGPQLFGKRAKLLIIDDDTLVSQIIFKAVQKNFDAKVSNDPIEALQLLQGEHDIDLVLCDLMMPEMNGRQLYEAALATNSAAPPFVFITGGGVTDDCIEFEQDMVRQGRLLYKPFKGTELRSLITETLTTDTDFFEREGSSLQQTQIVSLELDQKIFDDLTDLLGRDLTAQQYKQMVGDLREAMPKFELLASQNDADGLCQLSHSLNGAAKLLGLDAIGSLMTEIDVAARSNDLDKVQELIGTLPSYDAALTTFVNDLVSQS